MHKYLTAARRRRKHEPFAFLQWLGQKTTNKGREIRIPGSRRVVENAFGILPQIQGLTRHNGVKAKDYQRPVVTRIVSHNILKTHQGGPHREPKTVDDITATSKGTQNINKTY